MMGAGKTTIGRQLAKRLNKRFVDCDLEIEARTGVKVPVIFEIEGESGFRQREAQMVDSLTRETDLVLATGGGVVLDPANRRHLRERGMVFYLRVPPRILYERTRHDRNRPLLQVPDPLGRLESLHTERDPLYREVADLVIDGCVGTSGVLRRIEQELERQCAA
ncbi:MAG: shikimate kinase [Rhodocyclaceae bacterium]|nr:shikimate kinase [Rhodocyclaceae bacterium]